MHHAHGPDDSTPSRAGTSARSIDTLELDQADLGQQFVDRVVTRPRRCRPSGSSCRRPAVWPTTRPAGPLPNSTRPCPGPPWQSYCPRRVADVAARRRRWQSPGRRSPAPAIAAGTRTRRPPTRCIRWVRCRIGVAPSRVRAAAQLDQHRFAIGSSLPAGGSASASGSATCNKRRESMCIASRPGRRPPVAAGGLNVQYLAYRGLVRSAAAAASACGVRSRRPP